MWGWPAKMIGFSAMLATISLLTRPPRDKPSITSAPFSASAKSPAGRLGQGRFVLVEFAGIKSGFGDDALAVHQRDVAHRHADGHVVVGTGDGRGSSANDDDLEVGQRLALKFSSVEQGGCGDDGRAVLVVVHDGNVGGL